MGNVIQPMMNPMLKSATAFFLGFSICVITHRIWCPSDGKRHLTISNEGQEQISNKLHLNIKANVDPMITQIAKLAAKLEEVRFKLLHNQEHHIKLTEQVFNHTVYIHHEAKYRQKKTDFEFFLGETKKWMFKLQSDRKNENLSNNEKQPKPDVTSPNDKINETLKNQNLEENDKDKNKVQNNPLPPQVKTQNDKENGGIPINAR